MLSQSKGLRCWLAGIAGFVVSLSCGQAPAAEVVTSQLNWTGFLRYEQLNGVDPTKLPLTWTPESVAWKAKCQGYGQSCPVVWQDKVFLTSVEGPNKETYHVAALKLEDGSVLWDRTVTSTDPVKSTYLVSRSAPTPVCDAQQVYCFFESGDVVAFTHDGREVWKRALTKEFGKFDNKFGLAASPVQDDAGVYVLIDHDGPSYLLGLSKQDGKNLWKETRTGRRSWSSPYLAVIQGQPQILCSSVGSVDGYDPKNGTRLWTFTDVGGNSAATPVVFDGNHVLLGSVIRPSEGPSEKAEQSNLLGRIEKTDQGWGFRVDWVAAKARGSFSSPVSSAGYCYWVNSTGVVFCLDQKTGKEVYSKRLPCGACWATPLPVGDRIYFFGKDGETSVLKSGGKYEELAAANRLWAKVDRAEPERRAERPMPATPPKGAAEPAKKPEEARTSDPQIRGEPNAARRQAMRNGSGPIQYAALIVGNTILVRSGDQLFAIRQQAK